MAQKRYAIVRVDNHCPESLYDNIKKDSLCPIDGVCEKCKYGDTNEQLVNKIAQVIRRYRKNLEVCDYCDMKDEFEIAEKVVEFLGVEE